MSTSPEPGAQRDPFPRMIIVCCVIAVALLAIIFTAILLDFVSRGSEANAPPPFELFDAPPGTIEGNPVRPQGAAS
jgi:hypothetical protein